MGIDVLDQIIKRRKDYIGNELGRLKELLDPSTSFHRTWKDSPDRCVLGLSEGAFDLLPKEFVEEIVGGPVFTENPKRGDLILSKQGLMRVTTAGNGYIKGFPLDLSHTQGYSNCRYRKMSVEDVRPTLEKTLAELPAAIKRAQERGYRLKFYLDVQREVRKLLGLSDTKEIPAGFELRSAWNKKAEDAFGRSVARKLADHVQIKNSKIVGNLVYFPVFKPEDYDPETLLLNAGLQGAEAFLKKMCHNEDLFRRFHAYFLSKEF